MTRDTSTQILEAIPLGPNQKAYEIARNDPAPQNAALSL